MDTESIKRLNPIQDVIAETGGFELRGRGSYLKPTGEEGSSLVVDTGKQLFVWNSRGFAGDVISWLEHTQNMDFRAALEWLAHRAGIELGAVDVAAWKAARARQDVLATMAAYLQNQLAATPAALDWAAGRGWDQEALQNAGCGYWPGDRKGLRDHMRTYGVDPDEDPVRALLKAPAGFVYVHHEGGRPCYFTVRGITGKLHYNPPVELMGERRPYWNRAAGSARAAHLVIVEGQADAVTHESWGIPAVALAGVSADPQLINQLSKFETLFVALDTDDAGRRAALDLARKLGPMTRLVEWPNGAHDANDWHQAGGTAQECRQVLGDSLALVQVLADRVSEVDPLEREVALKEVTKVIAELEPYDYAALRDDLVRRLGMGMTVRRLGAIVKALAAETREEAKPRKEEVCVAHWISTEGHLAEIIMKPGSDENSTYTMLAVRFPDGTLREVHQLETETHIVRPIPASHKTLVEKGAVILASGIDEPESEAALFDRIHRFVHRWVDLPREFEMFAAYYIMLSWVFDRFEKLPYLRARGQSGSGKTRFNEVLGALCFRAVFGSGISSTASFIRVNQLFGGVTMIIDEADLGHREASEEWIALLNLGYQRKFKVWRTETNPTSGEWEPAAFSPYGPKVINMRGKFADDATESRCYTLETAAGKLVRDDVYLAIVGTDSDEFESEAQAIRNQLLGWRLRKYHELVPTYDHNLAQRYAGYGRLFEISLPLLSMSSDPAFKDDLLRFLESEMERIALERGGTIAAKVLEAILLAWEDPDDKARGLEEELHTKRLLATGDEETARAEAREMRLAIGHITRRLNELIDEENAEGSQNGGDSGKEYKSHVIGKIISNELNLYKRKGKYGSRAKVVPWAEQDNSERIDALVRRYGLVDRWLEIIETASERQIGASAAEKVQAPLSGLDSDNTK